MFSDKSDGSDKSEILLREQLVGRVGLVRLVRDPIKLLQPQEAAEHSPLWGDGGGFPLLPPFSEEKSLFLQSRRTITAYTKNEKL